uniref:Uncharacterized protein n=1 Tax=Anolis carolinensis TaxID=28377 RepID=H9G3X6_ANOCA
CASKKQLCSICLEYFKDPVIIDCGHVFCQKCIAQCWSVPDTDTSCPQCREPCQQRNLRPIRQLASIVEIAKKFSCQTARWAEILEEGCEHHQEPLKLFCEDDQILICVVCDKSKEHRQHKVIPKKEAFEEYREKIETERTKIVTEFKQLREFLDEKEQHLLTQLQDIDKEIQSINNEESARLSEEVSSIETVIKKMEEKHNQSENELLQVSLSRKKISLPLDLQRRMCHQSSLQINHMFISHKIKQC